MGDKDLDGINHQTAKMLIDSLGMKVEDFTKASGNSTNHKKSATTCQASLIGSDRRNMADER